MSRPSSHHSGRPVSLFAFEPGVPGVPSASATGTFIHGILHLLRTTPELDLRVRWLRPAGPRPPDRGGLAEAWTGARWAVRELRRVLADPTHYLLFIYPKVPVLAHVSRPGLLGLAQHAYRWLGRKRWLTRQRIVVIVEDLPIEMAAGHAAAGGALPRLPEARIRGIESALFRAAHRLVAPRGFVDQIREIHDVRPERFRTFRRNIYRTEAAAGTGVPDSEPGPAGPARAAAPAAGTEPDLERLGFEPGTVNFFYSGSIPTSLAANFREVLRSVRQAADARLHICGPDADAVRRWFRELDVGNARHYGRLDRRTHDALARSCDVGLILYPTDNPYHHLTPTMKYSAYLANGLAVLSTDLREVAANLREDGVGQAMPIRELSLELLRWATRPRLFADFRAAAAREAGAVRDGAEMRDWIDEIGRDE